jgi:acetylornithine/LysW-gamma-L-lysine aminotransferase
MSLTFEEIREIEEKHLAPTYQKMPIAIKSGRGCKVYDVNGKEYIDFMTGYGVAILGHGYPRVIDSIKSQLENIAIAHGSVYSEPRALFLKKLASITPKNLSSAYLSNSGAEAIEAALKVVLKATKRKKVIAMTGAYHGKTLGALSLTFAEKYRKAFDDIIYKGVEFVEYGNLEAVENGRKLDEYAAIFVEPIQGEGGIRLPPEDYLKGLREIADKNGILLVVDEVQSGLGRTGKIWAHEHSNIVPDVMTIGKGIGGGIPMGVTVARPELMNVLEVGEHTSTMGGNPLACAAGKAVLDALTEDKILENVQEVGNYTIKLLNEEVGKSRIVKEVRGKGLMIAVELRVRFLEVLFKAIELGLLTLYSGKTVLRMLPPLILSKEESTKATSILRESLNWYEKSKI